MNLADFLPDQVGALAATILVVASFIGSFVTAAIGIGGGVALLSVIAVILPAPAIIPVHGLVQIGSNAGRVFLMLDHVLWRTLLPFGLGSLAGALLGGYLAVRFPPSAIELGVGLFILWTLYLPLPTFGTLALPMGGFISSTLTMFFGSTGPFVASIVRSLKPDRLQQVATHSTLMSLQHLLKVLVFGLFGFAFADYAVLALAMIAAGFAGTYAGRSVLMRLDEKSFRFGFTAILTLLALQLVWSGLRELAG